jgi:hypothetical protein
MPLEKCMKGAVHVVGFLEAGRMDGLGMVGFGGWARFGHGLGMVLGATCPWISYILIISRRVGLT